MSLRVRKLWGEQNKRGPFIRRCPDLKITRGASVTVSVVEHREAKIAPSPRFPLIIPGFFRRNATGSDP